MTVPLNASDWLAENELTNDTEVGSLTEQLLNEELFPWDQCEQILDVSYFPMFKFLPNPSGRALSASDGRFFTEVFSQS